MSVTRFMLHPIIGQKRANVLFFWFLIVSSVMGLTVWYFFNSTLATLGLSYSHSPLGESDLIRHLFSPYMRVIVILVAAFFGATFVSQRFLGPFHRIMVWLKTKEAGYEAEELKLRDGDEFGMLVKLINKLYAVSSDE